MKRLLTLLFALVVTLSLGVAAQDTGAGTKADKKVAKAEKKEAKAAEKGKDMALTGWIRSEGDKTTFENDKDKQSWSISNPDAVKGHEGHHVKIKAKLNEADHSLNVDSLKMLRKSKQSGEAKAGKS